MPDETLSHIFALGEHPHREAIATLLHAHDYLWRDKTARLEDRLMACNLLFQCAWDLAHA